jgi:hypothetical protein
MWANHKSVSLRLSRQPTGIFWQASWPVDRRSRLMRIAPRFRQKLRYSDSDPPGSEKHDRGPQRDLARRIESST